jgi:hypothetical protein
VAVQAGEPCACAGKLAQVSMASAQTGRNLVTESPQSRWFGSKQLLYRGTTLQICAAMKFIETNTNMPFVNPLFPAYRVRLGQVANCPLPI